MISPFEKIEKKTEALKSSWYIWLFPLIAVGICIWLFVAYLKQKGPTIQITFDDASNIQAEKTRVRYRGVTIGVVKRITVADDNNDVIAWVDLDSDAEKFAVEGSKFWVVQPKVNFSGVSGLETIFAGTYIAVQPGKADAITKTEFKGQVNAESNEALENTASYYLDTANAESISVGDSITYRGLVVGTVGKVSLTKAAQSVKIQIHIQYKYMKLIRSKTVFWKKAGIQAKLGLFGSEIKVNSLDSILRGGLEFFNPDMPGEVAKPHSNFNLAASPPKGYEKWNPKINLY